MDTLKKRLKIRAHGCVCTMSVCMPEQNECKACALKKRPFFFGRPKQAKIMSGKVSRVGGPF